MNKSLIFDGRGLYSLMSVILVVVGIFIAVAVPPLGVFLIFGAIIRQGCFRGGHRRALRAQEHAARQAASVKARRERILAFKAMP